MHALNRKASVPGADLLLAVFLLLGLLILGYGYFHPHKVAFYGGLLLTLAGVIGGAIRVVAHGPTR